MPAFAGFITGHGLEFTALRGKFLELLQTPEGKAAMSGKGSRLALLKQVLLMLRTMLDDEWTAARGVDAVIYHPKALGGHSIAEKLGIPGVMALPLPLYSPTRAFPSPILSVASLGGRLNRASHRLMVRLATLSIRGTLNRWRRETLGLPPAGDELVLHGRPLLRLYGYSPALVPTPAGWDEHSVATGYWFLDQPPGWQPPDTLAAFLRAGSPPVYVGFGSMPAREAARTTALVLRALSRAGQRGVLATGWGGLAAADVPPTVYILEAAPHDWLFPHMAAVVHHGGAGTTAAGLRAGLPTVICPFFGDQPFWGRRVAALGVGPRPIPQRRLTGPMRLARRSGRPSAIVACASARLRWAGDPRRRWRRPGGRADRGADRAAAGDGIAPASVAQWRAGATSAERLLLPHRAGARRWRWARRHSRRRCRMAGRAGHRRARPAHRYVWA